MSIINEALKKAQENDKGLPESTPRLEGAGEDKIQISDKTKKESSTVSISPKGGKKFIFLIIIGIIIIGGIFIRKAPLMVHEKIVPSMPAGKILSNQTASDRAISNHTALPVLELNGIVYDDEKPYAIVNNKVLLQGDVIDGAKVIEINREAVKFIYNDKEVVLKAE